MHPDEFQPDPGNCILCACGMTVEKMRAQKVASIPESAVIDTGERKIVFVESAPGVFDSRAVALGSRVGEYYRVTKELTTADRIAARGAFLLDAEARLHPAAK